MVIFLTEKEKMTAKKAWQKKEKEKKRWSKLDLEDYFQLCSIISQFSTMLFIEILTIFAFFYYFELQYSPNMLSYILYIIHKQK